MHLYLENRRDIINPFEINSEMNFGVFYNAYYQRFVRYAFYYVNDLQAAEDLTHDALLYYWENKHKLPADADVLGYILESVKNKCLNYLKHIQVEARNVQSCMTGKSQRVSRHWKTKATARSFLKI